MVQTSNPSLTAVATRLKEFMNDYYVGPLVYDETDGIRNYRFIIYLREPHLIPVGEMMELLRGVASVGENLNYRKVMVSPLHQHPTMVRDQVVSFIQTKLGSDGYVERFTDPAVGRKVYGVVRQKDRTLTLGAHARTK